MDSIEPMYICLANGSEVVSDLICTNLIVFYDLGGHAINQHVFCLIIKNLQYVIVLGIDWLKSTYLVIDWMVCSLD